jgi:hypothetical protein
MTFLVERLAELHRHLEHLAAIRPRVAGRQSLERDLSLLRFAAIVRGIEASR